MPPQQAEQCKDYVGYSAADRDMLSSECRFFSQGYTFTAQACVRTGSLGGCTQSLSGKTQTLWFYPDSVHRINTSADVMAGCPLVRDFFDMGGRSTFVAP